MSAIDAALIAVLAVQMVLQHIRRQSCEERVHLVESEARRTTGNFYTALNRQAFEIYTEALKRSKEDDK